MSRRQQRELAKWESAARAWGTSTGRQLALDLNQDNTIPMRPYTVGLVLWDSEAVWAQIPARCSADTPPIAPPASPCHGLNTQPPITDWLVTNRRIAGRQSYYYDTLLWWRWTQFVGVRVDLTPGHEYIQLDLRLPSPPVRWWGPAVAPLAVAAIHCLHGSTALLDHPGLARLRQQGAARKPPLGEIGPTSLTLSDLRL